jgi:hypothetical protein
VIPLEKFSRYLGLFSALSDLYHYYRLTSSRKYLENFSNGITVVFPASLDLEHLNDGTGATNSRGDNFLVDRLGVWGRPAAPLLLRVQVPVRQPQPLTE